MIKVIGVGSPFGDDRIGWNCLEILDLGNYFQNAIFEQRLSLVKSDRPGMGLLNLIKDASIVFLIDAVKIGTEIGAIHRLQNQEIELADIALSSHGYGIGQAIQMGRILNILPKEIVLYGIEIGEVDYSAELSDQINRAKYSLIKSLVNEVNCIIKTGPV